MTFTITTGQFETGTREQQAAFVQLLGAEDAQYKFDFYFHWYNIAHEYGHCLCNYYESDMIDLKQEFLVNRFAVSLWRYAGYEKELLYLQKMLNGIMQGIKNPVPSGMSMEDYYEQIWGTDQLMDTAVYGYLQFRSVLMALESRVELPHVLKEMGIHTELKPAARAYKEYPVTAETAKVVLADLRGLLDRLGIDQPETDIELSDDPMEHRMCIKEADGSD